MDEDAKKKFSEVEEWARERISQDPFNYTILPHGLNYMGIRTIAEKHIFKKTTSRVFVYTGEVLYRNTDICFMFKNIPFIFFGSNYIPTFHTYQETFCCKNISEAQKNIESLKQYFEVLEFYKNLNLYGNSEEVERKLLQLYEFMLKYPDYRSRNEYIEYIRNRIYELKQKYNIPLNFKEYSWRM